MDLYSGGFGVEGQWNHLGNVVTAAGTTTTKGGVVRLFKGWNSIEKRANEGSFTADLIRNLSFHYNESDNFNPPASIVTDFFNKVLPPGSGTGKDYGFGRRAFQEQAGAAHELV